MYNQNNMGSLLNGYNPSVDYTKTVNQNQNTVNQQDLIIGAIVNDYEQVKNYPVSNQATTFLVLRDGTKAWSKYLNENGVAVISAFGLKRLFVENKPTEQPQNSSNSTNVLKPPEENKVKEKANGEFSKEDKLIFMFTSFKKNMQEQMNEMKKEISNISKKKEVVNNDRLKPNTSK